MNLKFTFCLLSLMLFVACDEYEELKRKESAYVTGLDVKFVFQDEDGKNLIEFEDKASFPITFETNDTFAVKEYEKWGDDGYVYNEFIDKITFDEAINGFYFETMVRGFDNQVNSEFYLKIGDSNIDTILAKSSFSTDCIGRNYCSTVQEVYYNGVVIFSNGELSEAFKPEYVYVRVEDDETANISLIN